jgi:hypothetical protein
MQRPGRIAKKRLQDDVLGALDVELHGVEMAKALLPDEVEQGLRRHADGCDLAGLGDLEARLAAVARVEEHGELARLVGGGAGHRLDCPERVLADVVGEPVEDLGQRLDGEDARIGPGPGGHEQRIGADIRADIDEGEPRAHAAAQHRQFLGVEELRREQHLLVADIVVRNEPHARPQPLDVERLALEQRDRGPAQQDRRAARDPALGRQRGGALDDAAGDPGRSVGSERRYLVHSPGTRSRGPEQQARAHATPEGTLQVGALGAALALRALLPTFAGNRKPP